MDYINWLELIEKETGEKIKIIISERDEKTKILLEEFFKKTGLEIEWVKEIKKIADILLNDPLYQIVILSLSKQEGELSFFIEKLKEINPNIKIFIILDYFKEEDIGRYFEKGVDEIILKPFTLNEFKARLSKLMKEHYLDIKLQKFIVEDPLTRIYNRRYFEEIIKEEVYKALRQNYSLSLMMIDLDNFKWYNDNYGHQEGDRLLKKFGEILQKNVRTKVDKACRYGGDEFVVILPYTSWNNAALIAERICKSWAETEFVSVTLSIGIAQLIGRRNLEETISDLIKRADKAMYEAKKVERNMWVVDEESSKQVLNGEFQDGD
jgi:diguanylate cyclase (GGDEF)-like protein